MSSAPSPPSGVKNLRPLRLKGRWLAVIITEPSQANDSSFKSMNMDGVEERPVNTAVPPVFQCRKERFRKGPARKCGNHVPQRCAHLLFPRALSAKDKSRGDVFRPFRGQIDFFAGHPFRGDSAHVCSVSESEIFL